LVDDNQSPPGTAESGTEGDLYRQVRVKAHWLRKAREIGPGAIWITLSWSPRFALWTTLALHSEKPHERSNRAVGLSSVLLTETVRWGNCTQRVRMIMSTPGMRNPAFHNCRISACVRRFCAATGSVWFILPVQHGVPCLNRWGWSDVYVETFAKVRQGIGIKADIPHRIERCSGESGVAYRVRTIRAKNKALPVKSKRATSILNART
jgi:hypothetical protein